MDIILPKNYAIKFNAEFIPQDFDKWKNWIHLDMKKIVY